MSQHNDLAGSEALARRLLVGKPEPSLDPFGTAPGGRTGVTAPMPGAAGSVAFPVLAIYGRLGG